MGHPVECVSTESVKEADFPIYYTSDTNRSACYYPPNFVDTRGYGIASGHKYYTKSTYSKNMGNLRFIWDRFVVTDVNQLF